MPIPTIPLPSAETEPLRAPYDTRRISADQFGAGLGEGLQQLGAGVEKIQAEQDALVAQDAESTYAREILEKVHGTTDQKTGEFKPGFGALKGHQALEASAQVAEELTKRREQLASELANDRQRRIFLGRTQDELLGAQRSIEAHVGEQVAYLRREGLKTRLETAALNAAAAAVTPGGEVDLVQAERQLEAMKPWLEVAAEQQGLTGDDAERFVRDGQGGVATAVMDRLLEEPGRAAQAKEFLEANRALLGEKASHYGTQIAKLTAAEDLGDKARMELDRLERAHPGDVAAQLAAAYEIPDTKLSDETVHRLTVKRAQLAAADAGVERERIGRLRQEIQTRGSFDRASPDFALLSDDGKADVIEREKAYFRSRRTANAEERRAQAQANAIARGEWANIEPDEIASVDIRSDRRFAGADEQTLLGLEGQQKKALRTPRVPLDQFRTRVKEVAKLRKMGKADAAKFMDRLSTWYLDLAEDKKRPPNVAEVREAIADALLVRDVPHGFDRPSFRLEEPEQYRPAAPEDQPDEATRELARRRLGAPVPAGNPPVTGLPAATPASRPARRPARTSAEVPPELRQRIVDDYREKYGTAPPAAALVAGYNAGLAAGAFDAPAEAPSAPLGLRAIEAAGEGIKALNLEEGLFGMNWDRTRRLAELGRLEREGLLAPGSVERYHDAAKAEGAGLAEVARQEREGGLPRGSTGRHLATVAAQVAEVELLEKTAREKPPERVRYVDQVPPEARQRIVDEYRIRYGRDPVPVSVVRLYNAGLAAGVF